MKIINIPLPKKESAQYFTNAKLLSSELEKLKAISQLTEVRYYYGKGYYEGYGQMLLQIAGSWRIYCLSHCSCYGPLEHLSLNNMSPPAADFEKLKTKCSEELWKEIEPLTKV